MRTWSPGDAPHRNPDDLCPFARDDIQIGFKMQGDLVPDILFYLLDSLALYDAAGTRENRPLLW